MGAPWGSTRRSKVDINRCWSFRTTLELGLTSSAKLDRKWFAFQIAIDKVLASRTLSTLDVLVIGLIAISFFDTILGILRTYLFAHTTNRIDVELGARLFRHLLALPISYFQARDILCCRNLALSESGKRWKCTCSSTLSSNQP